MYIYRLDTYIHTSVCMYTHTHTIITLYTLNLQSVICQLHLSKVGKKITALSLYKLGQIEINEYNQGCLKI